MSLGRDKIDLPKAFSLIICDFGMTVCSMTRCKIKSAALLDGAQARTRLSRNSFNTLIKQTNKNKVRKDLIVLVVQPRFQGLLLKGPVGERPVNKVITCKARLCAKRSWREPSAMSLWNPRCPHMISKKDFGSFFLPSWKEGLGSRDHKALLEYSLAAKILPLSRPNWLTLVLHRWAKQKRYLVM